DVSDARADGPEAVQARLPRNVLRVPVHKVHVEVASVHEFVIRCAREVRADRVHGDRVPGDVVAVAKGEGVGGRDDRTLVDSDRALPRVFNMVAAEEAAYIVAGVEGLDRSPIEAIADPSPRIRVRR